LDEANDKILELLGLPEEATDQEPDDQADESDT